MSFSSAATGMMYCEVQISNIANNIANSGTNGFKKQLINSADLSYCIVPMGTKTNSDGSISSLGLNIGNGVQINEIYSLQTPGELHKTDNPYDFAIGGTNSSRGYFKIDMPDGTIAYTRDGAFKLNSNREIVTNNGFIVSPGVLIPQSAVSVRVDESGNIYALGPDPSVAPQLVGTFDIVDFPEPSKLQLLGNNLAAETPLSGSPIIGVAGKAGMGQILQGFIEGSNVSPMIELTELMKVQRCYELCANVMKAEDETKKVANSIKS